MSPLGAKQHLRKVPQIHYRCGEYATVPVRPGNPGPVPFCFAMHGCTNVGERPSRTVRKFGGLPLLTDGAFFQARIDEIEKVFRALGGDIEFIKIAQGYKYRESLAIRNAYTEARERGLVLEKKSVFPVTN